MNLNKFAKMVAEFEGGKTEVNIAQIKEIIACVFAVGIHLDTLMSEEEINYLNDKLIETGRKNLKQVIKRNKAEARGENYGKVR